MRLGGRGTRRRAWQLRRQRQTRHDATAGSLRGCSLTRGVLRHGGLKSIIHNLALSHKRQEALARGRKL